MRLFRFLTLIVAVSFVPACATTADTFNQRAAIGYTTVTFIRDTSNVLVAEKKITPDDHSNVIVQADNLRAGIEVARALRKTNQSAAESKLSAIISALNVLKSYLRDLSLASVK